MAMLAAGALTLGAGVMLAATGETKAVQQSEKARATQGKGEKEAAVDPIVRGQVITVEPTEKTLSVRAMRGKKAETVGVDVPDTVKITQGKAAKTLADIKVGDRVWMKYDHTNDKLVADQIHILRSGKTAGKSASKNTSS